MVKQNKSTSTATNQDMSRVVSLSELELPEEQKRDTAVMFSSYVRSLMQNARQGTVSSKSRGEVAFSNKKPWKQKGTGRARVGSRRSPLWRKGGTIFGPQERVRTLKVSQATKRMALEALLRQQVEKGRVISLNWTLEQDRPKTSAAYNALKGASLHDKKVILFVSPEDYQAHASFNNLPAVHMLLFNQPNAYALASGDYWVFLTKDSEAFKAMVSSWI